MPFISIFMAVFALAGTATQAAVDSAVLRAVGEACFFKGVHWIPVEWERGEFVAFRPNYSKMSRSDFLKTVLEGQSEWSRDLDSIETSLERPMGSHERIEDFKSWKSYAESSLATMKRIEGPSASAKPALPLKSLSLGAKIVVAEVPRSFHGLGKVEGPDGKRGTPIGVNFSFNIWRRT